MKAADGFFADWRGLAADRKLGQVRESLKGLYPQLRTLNRNDLGIEGPGPGGFSNPYTEPPNEADRLEGDVNELARDLERTKTGARDDAYLKFANKAQHKIYVLLVRWQLLTYWRTAWLLARQARDAGIGDDGDRQGWWQVAFIVITGVKQQIAQPTYTTLPAKLEAWKTKLDALCKEIDDTAESEFKAEKRRQFWKRLAIAVVAARPDLPLGRVLRALRGAAPE